MKPYGLRVIEHPDCVDILEMAPKSSIGHLPRRSGDLRNCIRNVRKKAATRRYWARKARKENRALCEPENKLGGIG